jgi:hypothetical protein
MAKIDFEKHIIRKPVDESGQSVKGRQSPMTFMSSQLVPGCPIHLTLGWIYDIPDPNPHTLAQTKDYDQVVMYIGGNPEDGEDLGAELEYTLGDKSFNLNKSAAIYIPKGVKYGPITWKKVSRPCLEMVISVKGDNASNLKIGVPHKPGTDVSKYVITEPVYRENVRTRQGPLGPVMLYMCNDLIPDVNIYVDYLWIFGVPKPHILEHQHNFDEVVLHISADPYHFEDLGAEMQFIVDGQPLDFNSTTAVYIPKGIPHGPLTWKSVSKTHLQMPIVIGAGTLDDAAPGGYKGDESFFAIQNEDN